MNCYQDEFDQTNGLRYLNHAAVAPGLDAPPTR